MTSASGETVRLREVVLDVPWCELPTRVVADEDGVLALLLEPGAPLTYLDGHPLGVHPWSPQPTWGRSRVLRLYRDGEHYSVWLFFDDDVFTHWYLNFEQPFLRRPEGIDVTDHELDLIVERDGTRRWKDVEDLHPSFLSGRLTTDQLVRTLAAATEVAGLLDRDERWWASYDDWTPAI